MFCAAPSKPLKESANAREDAAKNPLAEKRGKPWRAF
jgi:hypothetical protein